MDCSTPGFPVHHQLPELTETHVHLVGEAIQPSHPLSSPSPPTFILSQHQDLLQWVSSSHQVSKGLELQHRSFHWIFRTHFLLSFVVQLSHPYMTTGKTTALTIWTFVGKVMSLLFNMLSRLVITFLPRNKLQSPSAVILELPKVWHCFHSGSEK